MLKTQKNILNLDEKQLLVLQRMSFHSARLYNSCLYNIRQYFFNNNSYLPFKEQYHQIKGNENFKLLINDSSQQVLRMVDKNFRSFFSLLNLKKKGKYSAPIHIPHYLNKEKGWHVYIAGRSCRVKDGKIHIGLSKLFRETYGVDERDFIIPFPKNLDGKTIHQIQFSPLFDGKKFSCIICYEDNEKPVSVDTEKYLSIDQGTTNLLTCFDPQSNKSFIIDGRYIKSVNQFYNKKVAKLQSKYEGTDVQYKATKRFMNLSLTRMSRINECFNLAVKYVIDYCITNGIGKIVIGDFSGSKQDPSLSKKSAQNFVQIPHGKLKMKLESKCKEYGIEYILADESYTSKACAYNLDEIPTYSKKETELKFSGYRETRGLYKVKGIDIRYNADVNGAINIYRKYIKKVSPKKEITLSGVRAASTGHPLRIRVIRKLDTQATKSLV